MSKIVNFSTIVLFSVFYECSNCAAFMVSIFQVGPTHQGISRFIGSFLTENMKRDSKNASCSSKPGGYRGKFTSRFCMFPKVKSADSSPGFVPVYLNVYDLTPANGYMYWAGLGIYHTGVESELFS